MTKTMKFRVYLPKTKEEYLCKSAKYKNGFLCLKGAWKYNAERYGVKHEFVGDIDFLNVQAIRKKLNPGDTISI